MLNYEEESFAVLFGSVARGDYNKNSDIDILLCNYPEDKAKKNIASINLPQLPVNFVLYDSNMLWKFHEEGSLFLYHIFKQGKLRRVRISTLRNENETFSQLNSITYIGVFLRLVTYSHLP
ncbi:nucleotidyltransferase domain-containing protein [Citrobacter freundii]|uniref:nucleotidyltransferase domain-containing protein n=1 Tax=Citrobacter freundii TaxID=546 RepID=UPI00387A2659